MKNLFVISALIILLAASCKQSEEKSIVTQDSLAESMPDTSDRTNNFYDNVETYPLPVTELEIAGEIANPGKVDFSKLQKHSVIVKEALLDSAGGNKFIGAYRYDGYSLFDILNTCELKKKNEKDFYDY